VLQEDKKDTPNRRDKQPKPGNSDLKKNEDLFIGRERNIFKKKKKKTKIYLLREKNISADEFGEI
jgi:hypothetical protein